jgi:hypothetical protein
MAKHFLFLASAVVTTYAVYCAAGGDWAYVAFTGLLTADLLVSRARSASSQHPTPQPGPKTRPRPRSGPAKGHPGRGSR